MLTEYDPGSGTSFGNGGATKGLLVLETTPNELARVRGDRLQEAVGLAGHHPEAPGDREESVPVRRHLFPEEDQVATVPRPC